MLSDPQHRVRDHASDDLTYSKETFVSMNTFSLGQERWHGVRGSAAQNRVIAPPNVDGYS